MVHEEMIGEGEFAGGSALSAFSLLISGGGC